MRERIKCENCGVWHGNGPHHECVRYDGPPCETCGMPTVFVTIGAPGVGHGQTCTNNHYHGTCRELTLADVI